MISCESKISKSVNPEDKSNIVNYKIEKIDSIQIEYLGNPIVHDINPLTKTVLFMEDKEYSQEIFIANFEGEILSSNSKFGDMPDTYGVLISPLFIDSDSSFLALGTSGFNRYSYEWELISNVPLNEIQIPNFRRNVMGVELVKIGGKYLTSDKGNRDINYDKINNYPEMDHFNLYDPKTGNFEPIIKFPDKSIYKSGKYFYRYAWLPTFTVENDLIFIVYGGEPVIYKYNVEPPFNLISSIPIELPNFRYYEGSNSENLGFDFFGLFKASARIENIKKFEDKFIVAYFQGYDEVDKEFFFAKKTPDESKELREKLNKKYQIRVAIFDSLGNLLNDFVPSDYEPSSFLIWDGQLWAMVKPDPDVEKDYFKLYRIDIIKWP